ncbi:epoxide hydrolase 4 [Aplysia californica]|uniref:Epoxide hydrolase 4 n=1 Tax=Aplysia californica TaxID=6500 RepID=A0ABM0JP62_APLCA|nr:epoxide hydrolase 4 [Aplysia californica]XP_035825620.1 epoxide hydrolase 4 [Aplysia californica]
MGVKRIQRGLYLLIIYGLAFATAFLTIVRVGVLLVTKGPRKMLHKKRRETEPLCFSDPTFGTHGYLHLEEVRLHYVSSGSPDKPLMLLVHGVLENWYSYRYQLREFSDKYRVVAIDQRGCGDSSRPSGIKEYQLERMVKDVKQIITALGYSKCVLIGHDWGGAVTWAFAGCYPDMVEKIVVCNSPHFHCFRNYVRTHWAQFKKSWYFFFFLLPILPEIYIGLNDYGFLDRIFLGKTAGVHTGAMTQEYVDAVKYIFPNISSMTPSINYIRANLLHPPSSRYGQKVTKPVLLIWGCRDFSLENGLAEKTKDFAYNMDIKYIKDACHFVHMDEPEKVNSYIREFLSKQSR